MREDWGIAPDGTRVYRLRIGQGGLTAHFLTIGATLQDIRLKGFDFNLVLGYDRLVPYLTNSAYFGATVGRFANRINRGRAKLDGKNLKLDRNFLGKHHLHGGHDGSSHRNWKIVSHTSDEIVFRDVLPDGHMGFPGNLTVTVAFRIDETRTLTSTIEAQTDAPTLCSFTNHNYFNLDGEGDIRAHRLCLNSDRYTEVNAEGIPTGDILSVDHTDYDFRQWRTLDVNGVPVDVDHNFCLNPKSPAATLTSDRSGIGVRVSTTAPGLQVYTGGSIPADTGYLPFAGVALEAQIWPDAPNHAGFPSAILRPAETYRQVTRFAFFSEK